jgi:similar to stage IV sporulation protein
MDDFLNYAVGYAVIKVTGASPEAVLNRCAEESIPFWSVHCSDSFTLTFRTGLKDAGRIPNFSDRCCCDIEIITRRGFPISAKKMKSRKVLWVLPVLLCAALIVSSLFVWKIEVVGNETVSKTEIINALAESGVYIGSFWPKYEADMIRSRVLLQIPELKWAGVSIFGSRVVIQVREATEIPELFDADTPVRIVAAESGIIERLDALRGMALMKDGDTAVSGDTIIDGIVLSDRDGETRVVHAKGSVFARTWYEISAIMPLSFNEKVYSGKTSRQFAIICGEKRINFYGSSRIIGGSCDIIVKEYNLGIKGLFSMPLSLVSETARYYDAVESYYSQAEIKTALSDALETELSKRIGDGGEIFESNLTFAQTGNFAVATLRAECRQDIAAEQEIPQSEADIALQDGKEEQTQ